MTAATGSQDMRAGGLREWCFEVTPPRRSTDPLAGRQDTCTIPVRIRRIGHLVHFVVADHLVATTRCTTLRRWIDQQGMKAPYIDGRLILNSHRMGIWLEVEDVVAPTLLVACAVSKILAVLGDQ